MCGACVVCVAVRFTLLLVCSGFVDFLLFFFFLLVVVVMMMMMLLLLVVQW